MSTEFSEAEALRWGLTFFLHHAAKANWIQDAQLCVSMPESVHPFGSIGPSLRAAAFHERTIYFVEDFTATTTSVETMTKLLATSLQTSPEKQILLLQITSLEADKDDNSKHDLFYEVVFQTHVLICGGCNDCSGGGLKGKRTMDSLFLLLSKVYEVEIKTKTIPYNRAQKIIASLDARIKAYHKE